MSLSALCVCGKQIQAGDDLAGKQVKCPACGSVVVLPVSASPAANPLHPLGAGPTGVSMMQQPVTTSPASTQSAAVKPALYAISVAAALVGFVLICIGTAMPWITLTAKNNDEVQGQIKISGFGSASVAFKNGPSKDSIDSEIKTDGALVLVIAILGIVTCSGLLMGISPALAKVFSAKARTIVCLCVLGASILLLVWHVAWTWKNVSLSKVLHQGGMPLEVFPGLGLFLGIGGAIVVAAALSVPLGKMTSRMWMYVAEGAGALLGLLVLAVIVVPWSADGMGEKVMAVLFKSISG